MIRPLRLGLRAPGAAARAAAARPPGAGAGGGQAARSSGGHDLADSGLQRLAEHHDVDPGADQDDTHVRPVQLELLRQLQGHPLVEVGPDDDQQLPRVLVEAAQRLVRRLDDDRPADGEGEALCADRIRVDQHGHGLIPVKRFGSLIPLFGVAVVPLLRRAKVDDPGASAG